jgi:threonine dehydratase
MKIKWGNIFILCCVGFAGFIAGIATAIYVIITHIDIHVPAPAPAQERESLLYTAAAAGQWPREGA